jgi:hypothetical protein
MGYLSARGGPSYSANHCRPQRESHSCFQLKSCCPTTERWVFYTPLLFCIPFLTSMVFGVSDTTSMGQLLSKPISIPNSKYLLRHLMRRNQSAREIYLWCTYRFSSYKFSNRSKKGSHGNHPVHMVHRETNHTRCRK